MKNIFLVLLLFVCSYQVHAQDHRFQNRIHTQFELHVDSLERCTVAHKQYVDTVYWLHFSVKNTSGDTLTYVTNSCFYYNHFTMIIGRVQFEVNENGGCLFNEQQPHIVAPGASVRISEWITSAKLNQLDTGEWDGKVIIPLIRDTEQIYRVDGRYLTQHGNDVVGQEEYLIFEGRINIVQTYTEGFKGKKKGKSKSKKNA
ncbi:hypothetical protein H9Y05_09040 [Crocinitomicaceae bacterium CZZ-1]|uniref:Uncharacterized protein n=1 Tax=Taishania pollutisoli TaxID=2766479 RepID=A0A8J6PJ72_9FLAO|nr:hypothetical protein [Taishania pollutisoli]MBC9812614.1 hypothetical protein [Taishania pollutisoli]MBX2949226.1 hypothetical protein [Crocinitomicaceae bacterium]